jgi:hypothetical protein
MSPRESNPRHGVKDPVNVRDFVKNARAYFDREESVTESAPFMSSPDERGHFGDFGGRFVPEALMPACLELETAFVDAWSDPVFLEEYERVLRQFAGRPTPVTPLDRLSEKLGIHVYAKREDLAHTGSHKINNVIGQTLLAQAHGQESRDRRDGCRTTRRCDRDGGRATWS